MGVSRQGGRETAVNCSGVRARTRIANAGKTLHSRRLVDGAVEDGGDLAHLVGKGGKFFGEAGLHAVGERFVRFVLDYDEQAIGANSDGSAKAGELYGACRCRGWDRRGWAGGCAS